MVKESTFLLKRQQPYIIKGGSEILIGRPEGASLAKRLLSELESLPPDIIVPLDFRNIEAMDFSCADEFLTKIIRRIMSGELGSRFIALQRMSVNVEESIIAVLTIRELAVPKFTKQGKVEVLGKVGAELVDTYMLAIKKGRLTARDVTEIAPKVGISAISNRLTRLQKMGLLVKEKTVGAEGGGRQFVYVPVG